MEVKIIMCILIPVMLRNKIVASVTDQDDPNKDSFHHDYNPDYSTTALGFDDDVTTHDGDREQLSTTVTHGDEQLQQLFTEQIKKGNNESELISRIVIQQDVTKAPLADYEVTENVIDIPDNSTVFGPIVTNFTIFTPLNNATATTVGNNVANNNITAHVDNIKALRKSYISIFHVKAEFDSKPDSPSGEFIKPFIHVNQTVNIHKPYFQPFKDYLHGVKKGLANGLHSILSEHKYPEANNGVSVPGIVATPVLFLNKLRKHSSAVADRVHNAIFGPRRYALDYEFDN